MWAELTGCAQAGCAHISRGYVILPYPPPSSPSWQLRVVSKASLLRTVYAPKVSPKFQLVDALLVLSLISQENTVVGMVPVMTTDGNSVSKRSRRKSLSYSLQNHETIERGISKMCYLVVAEQGI